MALASGGVPGSGHDPGLERHQWQDCGGDGTRYRDKAEEKENSSVIRDRRMGEPCS